MRQQYRLIPTGLQERERGETQKIIFRLSLSSESGTVARGLPAMSEEGAFLSSTFSRSKRSAAAHQRAAKNGAISHLLVLENRVGVETAWLGAAKATSSYIQAEHLKKAVRDISKKRVRHTSM